MNPQRRIDNMEHHLRRAAVSQRAQTYYSIIKRQTAKEIAAAIREARSQS